MADTSWLRQTGNEPLFADLLWSQPENKNQAGKLLILGGNLHGFKAVAAAHQAATKAGAGVVKILLPDALKKLLGKSFGEAEFTSSTSAGSFSREALALFLDEAEWADGVLLAGDFGKNSETAILLESFINKQSSLVVMVGDSLDYFANSPKPAQNNNIVVVGDIARLQKIAKPTLIKHSFDLLQMVNALSKWTMQANLNILTRHAGQIITASHGRISTTPAKEVSDWEVQLAAYASVWCIQHPQKPFEALTTAAFGYTKE
ncbi:MAG: hypothetical protein WD877_02800 [Candidatus Saccharimonadales bacterium]